MRFINLFSSSSGNCAFLEQNGERILIDCGINAKRVEASLREIGVNPKTIKAIFITHEHSDHIIGAGKFAKRNSSAIFASCGTWRVLDEKTPEVADEKKFVMNSSEVIDFDEIEIAPFDINHDCAEPLGFLLNNGVSSIGYATDIGKVDSVLKCHLKCCKFIYLEANHDIEMLKNGSYPPFLKKRILGTKGHLSNIDCACFAKELTQNGNAKHIRLAHLSEHNNTPLTAYTAVKTVLEDSGFSTEKDIKLDVAMKNVTGSEVNI